MDENVLIPSAYSEAKGDFKRNAYRSPTYWNGTTVAKMLEKPEYAGHTAYFKTYRKSYKQFVSCCD